MAIGSFHIDLSTSDFTPAAGETWLLLAATPSEDLKYGSGFIGNYQELGAMYVTNTVKITNNGRPYYKAFIQVK